MAGKGRKPEGGINWGAYWGSSYWDKKERKVNDIRFNCACGCEIITKIENLPVTCDRCRTKHEMVK